MSQGHKAQEAEFRATFPVASLSLMSKGRRVGEGVGGVELWVHSEVLLERSLGPVWCIAYASQFGS